MPNNVSVQCDWFVNCDVVVRETVIGAQADDVYNDENMAGTLF